MKCILRFEICMLIIFLFTYQDSPLISDYRAVTQKFNKIKKKM